MGQQGGDHGQRSDGSDRAERSEQAYEGPKERVDREMGELLQEARVALPGVQVLLAFLLTLPFTQRADVLDTGQRRIYFAATLLAGLAAALLLAPTAHHRQLFRSGNKESVVRLGGVLVLAGTLCVAAAVGLVVYLVGTVMFNETVGAWGAGLLTGVTLLLWLSVPTVLRLRGNGTDGDAPPADDGRAAADDPGRAPAADADPAAPEAGTGRTVDLRTDADGAAHSLFDRADDHTPRSRSLAGTDR